MCAREGLTTYFTFMKKPINAKVLFENEEKKFFGRGIIPHIIISGTMYYFHNCADIFGQIRTPIVDRSSFFMENIIGGLLIEFF